MIKNLDLLAKFVEGGAEVLQKAIEAKEEVEIKVLPGELVTDDSLNQLKKTRFEDGKKEGHTIGYDFAIKDMKKDFGIELEGKDRAAVVEAVKAKIMADAKIEPDKKVQELNASLEKLQKTYKDDLSGKDKEIETYKQTLQGFKINSDLTALIPAGLNGIKPQHFATIARTEYSFDYEGEQLVAKKNGAIIKDKMEKPIPVADVLTEFAKTNGWIGEGGRGGRGGGGTSGAFKTIYDVYAHMEKNKIDPMSDEGQKLITGFNNA